MDIENNWLHCWLVNAVYCNAMNKLPALFKQMNLTFNLFWIPHKSVTPMRRSPCLKYAAESDQNGATVCMMGHKFDEHGPHPEATSAI